MTVESSGQAASQGRRGRCVPRTRRLGVRLLAGLTLGLGLLSVPVAAHGAPRKVPPPTCTTDQASIGKIPIVFIGSDNGLEEEIESKLGSLADGYALIMKIFRARGGQKPSSQDTGWTNDWKETWGQGNPSSGVVSEVAEKIAKELSNNPRRPGRIAVVVVKGNDAGEIARSLEAYKTHAGVAGSIVDGVRPR